MRNKWKWERKSLKEKDTTRKRLSQFMPVLEQFESQNQNGNSLGNVPMSLGSFMRNACEEEDSGEEWKEDFAALIVKKNTREMLLRVTR